MILKRLQDFLKSSGLDLPGKSKWAAPSSFNLYEKSMDKRSGEKSTDK